MPAADASLTTSDEAVVASSYPPMGTDFAVLTILLKAALSNASCAIDAAANLLDPKWKAKNPGIVV